MAQKQIKRLDHSESCGEWASGKKLSFIPFYPARTSLTGGMLALERVFLER